VHSVQQAAQELVGVLLPPWAEPSTQEIIVV
jgi:hypothetical protein